ncbi:MAG: amidohydrolase [Aeromicrobium sp.]
MDLIVCADTVHTLGAGPDGPDAPTAVGVRGGLIAAVGSRDEVLASRTADTRVIELGAGTLVPGLIDAHSHPVSGALITRGADLTGLDLDGVRDALGAVARELPDDAWVLAWGLDPNIVPDGRLAASHVDDVLGGRPALVRLFDAHSALASSVALERAGVTGPRSFDQSAEIVCDADGRPTGLLSEPAAIAVVEDVLPAADLDELGEAVLEVLQRMAAQGLTELHAMEHMPYAGAVLTRLEERGDLPVRVRCSPWVTPGTTEADWAEILDQQGVGGRRWVVRGVKMFMDGTIDNGTAWLESPDTLGESLRPFWPDPAHFVEALQWFDGHGVPTATHAIGDQAVRHVLEALRSSSSGVRHRIEHIETIPDDILPMFAELSVGASMQPTHCTEYTKPDASDNWSRRLGPERTAHGWRINDLRAAGAHVALGSDWPIADSDPRGILSSARLRRRGGAPEQVPIHPEQAISALKALEGYTSHAAWSVDEDRIGGTIEVGKRADLTAFAGDPLTVSADELAATAVLATVVDGTVSHLDASVA